MKKALLWFFLICAAVSDRNAWADSIQFQFRVLKPDNSPAVGAKALFRDSVSAKKWHAVADSQGLVTTAMPRKFAGTWLVDVPGYALSFFNYKPYSVEAGKGQEGPRTIHLSLDHPTHGVTTDEQGIPLKGVYVSALLGSMPKLGSGFLFYNQLVRQSKPQFPELATRSGADGSFSFRGFDNDIQIIGFMHRQGQTYMGVSSPYGLRKDGAAKGHLVLYPIGVIRGQVVDSVSGNPVPGAQLGLSAYDLVTSIFATPSGMPDWDLERVYKPSPQPFATTDAQGLFTLEFIRPVTHIEIHLQAPNKFWDSVVTLLDSALQRGTVPVSLEGLKIPLRHIATVGGHVRDARAESLLMPVKVSVVTDDELEGIWKIKTPTPIFDFDPPIAADGTFKLLSPTGKVTLKVTGPLDHSKPQKIVREDDGRYTSEEPTIYGGQFPLTVSPSGIKDLNLAIERAPSVILSLSLAARKLNASLLAQVREPDGTISEHSISSYEDDCMLPVSKWGDALEVRIMARFYRPHNGGVDREILPWTQFIADEKRISEPIQLPPEAASWGIR